MGRWPAHDVRYNYFRGRQEPVEPYGSYAPNGLNFDKSVSNPNSRLSKIVRYIRENGPTSRHRLVRLLTPKTDIRVNGWGSGFFALAIRTGFITKSATHGTYVYNLGPRANLIK